MPIEWRRPLIVPVFKKGDAKLPGNYRGISLLSIPGKVYALLLMRRVSAHVELQMHEAQCGFRPGRGTVDAMYTMRQILCKCERRGCAAAFAFVDLTKAYDSVNRAALWRVLKLYGVHPKLISLLEDLHQGTQAAVRLDRQIGTWFDVGCGVKQGCIIAPLLFNVFMDFLVRKAVSRMGECGITIDMGGAPLPCEDNLVRLVQLLYADDLVLMSHDPEELAHMLVVLDGVMNAHGMRINAAKTEIMLIPALSSRRQSQAHDVLQQSLSFQVQLAGGVVHQVEEFKYLGSYLQKDGGCDRDVTARRGKTWGVFQGLKGVWNNRHLRLKDKAAVYRTFVMPHLLYGVETLNLTQLQLQSLEVTHNNCLRQLIGVRIADRQPMDKVREACGLPALRELVVKRTLSWLGHVARMPPTRYPWVAQFGDVLAGSKRRGRPKQCHEHTHMHYFKLAGFDNTVCNSWHEVAQDRIRWRQMWQSVDLAQAQSAPRPPLRMQPVRAARLRSVSYAGMC